MQPTVEVGDDLSDLRSSRNARRLPARSTALTTRGCHVVKPIIPPTSAPTALGIDATENEESRQSVAPATSFPDIDSTTLYGRSRVDRAALEALRANLPTLPPIRETDGLRGAEARPQVVTPVTRVSPLESGKNRATLTVVAGVDAGATFTIISAETRLGRGADAAIQADSESVSRSHARIVRSEGDVYTLEDLGSTNGTFVGGRRIKRVVLRSGDLVQLGLKAIFRFSIVDELEEELQRRLYESASSDTLTGLVNRRTLSLRLEDEVGHARRGRKSLAMLMLDVDFFKHVNDTFGHVAGDQVLRAIAATGSEVIRAGDTFARYGGEEFAVLARDASKTDACALAERLRAAIAALRVELGDCTVHVSVSVGVATLTECNPDDDGLALVARADSRLYGAKLAGRNCVCSDD